MEDNKTNTNWSKALGYISPIAQIAGDIFTNFYNNKQQKEQMALNYKYNEQAADNADARQRKMYEDYYSPAAQLKQLQDAGLSPSLMYGNGSGVVGSAQGAQGNGTEGPSAIPMQATQFALMQAQIKNLDSQANKNNAEAKDITDTLPHDIQILQDTSKKLQQSVENMQEDLKLITAKIGDTNASREQRTAIAKYYTTLNALEDFNLEFAKKAEDVNLETLYQNARLIAANADGVEKCNKWIDKEKTANIKNIQQDTALKASYVLLNKSQEEVNEAQVQKFASEIIKMSNDMEIDWKNAKREDDKLQLLKEQFQHNKNIDWATFGVKTIDTFIDNNREGLLGLIDTILTFKGK